MQKFETLRQPLLGELAMSRKRERKKERGEKNAIYSGHLRLCQQPRAAHALRSDQWFFVGVHPCCKFDTEQRFLFIKKLLTKKGMKRCLCLSEHTKRSSCSGLWQCQLSKVNQCLTMSSSSIFLINSMFSQIVFGFSASHSIALS